MIPVQELQEKLYFSKKLAEEAGRKILDYHQKGFKVDYKTDHSPVTIADQKAEELIREALAKQTPNYGIIGEEFSDKAGSSSMQWTIDPIDGTKSFICGVPLFSVLISLLENQKSVLGVVHFPVLNLTLSAIQGQGSFLNDSPCRVSEVQSIKKSVLLDGSITTLESMGYTKAWKSLRTQCKFHRGWGDAYGYLLVATGKAEVMFDPIAEIWDLAPMSVIISEAGGQFSSVSNGCFIKDRSGLATNGFLHPMVTKSLSENLELNAKR